MILAALALAQRPTEGGSYAFDDTDVVTSVDSAGGGVRVWYSTEGNNAVQSGDDDADGVPDFAETVAATAEDVLAVYAATGFRSIPADGGEGGSDAMDVYLVDFAGTADGHYSAESCEDDACSGYFVMENDFSGYGYSSDEAAIAVLTSHELFHGIQGAYDYDEESWYTEGTAVWAERHYDPASEDFLWFCDAYLEEPTRQLSEPPSGPVPTFAYATALWWWFVTEQEGTAWMVGYLEATPATDDLPALLGEQLDLTSSFVRFAEWNLATGSLAGVAESYDFAAEIGPPVFEARASALDDDQRFYPLSTTYYRLNHGGGALQFGLEADAPSLVFELWATDAEGRVTELVAAPAPTAGIQELGDFEEGTYYFVGVNPSLDEDSTKVRFCLDDDVSDCVPVVEDSAADTGKPEDDGGCGCASGPGAAAPGLLAALALLRRRRAG